MTEFFNNYNIIYIEIAFFVFLLILELIFSVSLSAVDYFFDADIEIIEGSISEREKNKMLTFLENKYKYENRFHAALITVNIFMFEPIRFFSIYFYKFFYYAFFENLVLSVLIVVLFVLIVLFLNFLFFFSLPRRIINHSAKQNIAKIILASVKISIIFIPIADFSDVLIQKMFKILGLEKYNRHEKVTEENIKLMVHESHDQGVLEADEAEMINNIFELNDKEAKDIMTNRNSIIGINAETSLPDAIKIMLEESNSRYPVYIDNLDHIIGILNLKDALRYQNANKSRNGAIKRYPKLLREARFVSETRKIDDLFHKMQSDKLQMVIVIDEYGQTSGLVAMEDIVEEIVGNILDEYDKEETFIESRSENVFEIDGLTPLEEIEEKFGIDFNTKDFETINGYMINYLGHIPTSSETVIVECGNYKFSSKYIDNHVIKSVIMEKIEEIIVNSDNDDKEIQDIEKKLEK